MRIAYHAHIKNVGWTQNWAYNGTEIGSGGQGDTIEAVRILLENAPTGYHVEFLGKPEGQVVSTAIDTLINGGIAASMTTAISRSWDSKGWYQELPSGLTRGIGRFVQPSKALSLVKNKKGCVQ